MKTKLIYIALLSIFILSCEKDVLVTSNTKNTPVIESFIVSGTDSIVVNVSTLKPYSNDTLDTVEPISGLKLYINNIVMKEASSGVYYYASKSIVVKPKDTFNIKLTYNNVDIKSQTIVPSKPIDFAISTDTVKVKQVTTSSFGPGPDSFVNLELTWDNSADDYHFLVIEWLDKSRIYTNTLMSPDDIKTKRLTPANQDDTYNINQMELGLYGKYRAVLCTINKEYYDLLETTNLNSNNMANPPSNVTNGWGLFTSMSTDTLYFWVLKK